MARVATWCTNEAAPSRRGVRIARSLGPRSNRNGEEESVDDNQKSRAADARSRFCMMTTPRALGCAHGQCNNGEVEFDGDVWFFSGGDTRKVREIEATPRVDLAYADVEQWRFVSMSGRARIVRDVAKKQELWLDELERWFEDGPESDDVVLIKVTPTVVPYWTKSDEGELSLK